MVDEWFIHHKCHLIVYMSKKQTVANIKLIKC